MIRSAGGSVEKVIIAVAVNVPERNAVASFGVIILEAAFSGAFVE